MIIWGGFFDFLGTGVPYYILFPSLLFTGVVLTFIVFFKKENKKNYLIWTFLIEYIFIVACSTVVCREKQTFEFERLELSLFWTYKSVVAHTPGVSVWDIVLNIALFIPLGLLVKLLYPSISSFKMLIIALLCSICIEVNQYLFVKGVVQADDVMHNTIGSLIGWVIAAGVSSLRSLYKKGVRA